MHYVSVEGLTKSYGIQPLFSGISFHIEEGDKIALVARNGTGKSTLLQIVAGILAPTSSKVGRTEKDAQLPGAVAASAGGMSPQGALSLLGALLAIGMVFAPYAAAAALRVSLE